jgi:hypothetical protein
MARFHTGNFLKHLIFLENKKIRKLYFKIKFGETT